MPKSRSAASAGQRPEMIASADRSAVEPEVDGEYRAACRASATIAPTIPTSSIMRWSAPSRSATRCAPSPRVRPKILIINGGDGTVQAALTEIHNGGHFGDRAAARRGASQREDQPHRARPRRSGRPDRGARPAGRARPVGPQRAHRRARADRASLRSVVAAGDRHVPRRRGPRRHDALLPRQDLSARAFRTA